MSKLSPYLRIENNKNIREIQSSSGTHEVNDNVALLANLREKRGAKKKTAQPKSSGNKVKRKAIVTFSLQLKIVFLLLKIQNNSLSRVYVLVYNVWQKFYQAFNVLRVVLYMLYEIYVKNKFHTVCWYNSLKRGCRMKIRVVQVVGEGGEHYPYGNKF
ncbi:hypothetical protein KUTeg_012574 [Tegillarca granosa]|uniref:Uncharacterized protein n=1 Tax=Tegillarca granosa TaxID=220873 RepID=A0ABQ9F052_TEGGR|nr:hypothetical protein KUTeg_012574 [Tegillarca granosa]